MHNVFLPNVWQRKKNFAFTFINIKRTQKAENAVPKVFIEC